MGLFTRPSQDPRAEEIKALTQGLTSGNRKRIEQAAKADAELTPIGCFFAANLQRLLPVNVQMDYVEAQRQPLHRSFRSTKTMRKVYSA